jgi:hypothetical protein
MISKLSQNRSFIFTPTLSPVSSGWPETALLLPVWEERYALRLANSWIDMILTDNERQTKVLVWLLENKLNHLIQTYRILTLKAKKSWRQQLKTIRGFGKE